MLVLTRKKNEKIRIGDNVVVTVIDIGGGRVKLGVEAPKEVSITRPDANPPSDEPPQSGGDQPSPAPAGAAA